MTATPIVIAHRGASGYLPEHTLAAKALAYGLGADYLEQDVVATRDGQLVVLHDLYLDDVTDVAQRFPGRSRSDGRHYVIDFDLSELSTLSVVERRAVGSTRPKYPGRFPPDVAILRITTLADELRLVQGLNKSMGRTVGIYPEIKEPAWHRRHGVDLAKLLLAELSAFGYSRASDPVFVQCFDAAELVRVRVELGTQLRLIQLVSAEHGYSPLLTAAGLRELATHVYGLGPHHSQLVSGEHGQRPRVEPLVHRAHDAGIRLHPYTFRRDELPSYARTLEDCLEFFIAHAGVDGLFCDHPDVAVRVRAGVLKVQ
jgi:glycerophosphoryl diester phosphodiesterase